MIYYTTYEQGRQKYEDLKKAAKMLQAVKDGDVSEEYALKRMVQEFQDTKIFDSTPEFRKGLGDAVKETK